MTLEAWVLGSMALELVLLLALLWHSRGHVRQGFTEQAPDHLPPGSGAWPRAAVVIPLTGSSPGMKPALQSLLSQDYPDYETVLVTRDLEDPAIPVVRELLGTHPRTRHVVSGPASRCSQKNHNLLAGLAVLDPGVEVLVFCDSTHPAPPHFLRTLVAPLRRGEALLTTGYHRVVPGDFRVATLGMLQTVLALHLLQGFPRLAQPWGGATAVRRAVFQDQGVARVWSEAVVDDVSLAAHLLRAGIRVQSAPAACLRTAVAGQTLAGWDHWLFRQIFYLKYFFPFTWLAAALGFSLLAGPVLLAGVACLGGLAGYVSGTMALAGLVFLGGLSGVGAWYRTLVPQRLPLGPWLAAFYAALFMAFWCYAKTWCTHAISWRGTMYRVTWGGKVREIIRMP